MEYNDTSTPLRLREYGRNVQNMAEQVVAETDPEKKYRLATELVRIMGLLTIKSKDPKEMADQRKKLWEHLYRVTDYRLELPQVSNPPTPTALRPLKRIEYYPYHSRYRQYGKNVELMIQEAIHMPDSPAREQYILQIANIMKQFLTNYGGGSNDQSVFNHLRELSEGRINLTSEDVILRSTQAQRSNTGSKPAHSNRPNNANKKRKKKGGHGGHGNHPNNNSKKP